MMIDGKLLMTTYRQLKQKQNLNIYFLEDGKRKVLFFFVSSFCDQCNPQMSLKPILDDDVIFIWPTLSLSR